MKGGKNQGDLVVGTDGERLIFGIIVILCGLIEPFTSTPALGLAPTLLSTIRETDFANSYFCLEMSASGLVTIFIYCFD